MRIHRGLGDSVPIEKPNIHTRLISEAMSLANTEESIYCSELGSRCSQHIGDDSRSAGWYDLGAAKSPFTLISLLR